MKRRNNICLIAAATGVFTLSITKLPDSFGTLGRSQIVTGVMAANAAEAAVNPGTQNSQENHVFNDGARRPPAPTVTVAPARERNFVESLFLAGTLVARDEVLIGAPADGLRIVELLAEDGDRVAKGQVLARLDRSQLDALVAQNDAALIRAEAAIGQARSQIDQFDAARSQATADLGRARKLDAATITQATLDQRIAAARSAEAQFAAANSALAVAQADKASRAAERRELMVRLDRTEIRAPVVGLVSRRTARLGAVAMSASEALFRLLAEGAIDLEAEIPEQSLARLKTGMRAEISLPGVEDRVVGYVRLISQEVDKATRIGKARIALPLDTNARIGSFASGFAVISQREGLAVPSSAVQRMETGDFVQVVKDDRIELRRIAIGITNERTSEVRQGLSPGERIVVRAAAFLRSGDIVQPMASADDLGNPAKEATK
jgi:RND family efflux transporter MFP subunit